jgi:hypothetical protein
MKPENLHAGMSHGLAQRLGLEARVTLVGHGYLLLLHADGDLINAVQAS